MQEREPTLLEAALLIDRRVMLIVLGAVPIASWLWIVLMARDMYGPMNGAAAWMMTTAWNWPQILLLVAMWVVMMTAMMLPTAAPLILLYATAARRSAEPANPARASTRSPRGTSSVWALFSIVLAALQRILASWFVLTPMMEPATPAAGAVLLAIAGVYQLTPLKLACLRVCRSPLGFMMQRWRSGVAGAFRLGLGHGALLPWLLLGADADPVCRWRDESDGHRHARGVGAGREDRAVWRAHLRWPAASALLANGGVDGWCADRPRTAAMHSPR